jgi:hypothetical protein
VRGQVQVQLCVGQLRELSERGLPQRVQAIDERLVGAERIKVRENTDEPSGVER